MQTAQNCTYALSAKQNSRKRYCWLYISEQDTNFGVAYFIATWQSWLGNISWPLFLDSVTKSLTVVSKWDMYLVI